MYVCIGGLKSNNCLRTRTHMLHIRTNSHAHIDNASPSGRTCSLILMQKQKQVPLGYNRCESKKISKSQKFRKTRDLVTHSLTDGHTLLYRDARTRTHLKTREILIERVCSPYGKHTRARSCFTQRTKLHVTIHSSACP